MGLVLFEKGPETMCISYSAQPLCKLIKIFIFRHLGFIYCEKTNKQESCFGEIFRDLLLFLPKISLKSVLWEKNTHSKKHNSIMASTNNSH